MDVQKTKYNYRVLASTLVFLSLAMAQDVFAAWYDSDWLYRQKITLSSSVTDADLSGVPYLIEITDAGNALFTRAQPDGDDVLFTASDGVTKLNHEIETFSTSSKQLMAWVRITSLSSITNTDIYMYYGQVLAPSQQNPMAVWDSTYKGVWHLDEDSSGTGALDLYEDVTGNGSHGDDSLSATGQAGQVDGGQEFDGADDYVDLDDHVGTYASLAEGSLSLWFKYTDTLDYRLLFSTSCNTDDNSDLDIMYYLPSNVFMWGIREDGVNVVNCSFPENYADGSWHYYVLTVDTSGNHHYVDGSKITCDYTFGGDSSTQAFFDAVTGLNTLRFGNREDFSGNQYHFGGSLDEIRISSTPRSAVWITASYRNQFDPSTYQTLFPEEQAFTCIVDTDADSLDGDTTSVAALNADRGADGKVSLREAMIACNNTAGTDTIAFAIGSGMKTIQPTSALPPITDTVVIDGTTQPGFVDSPIIELDGASAGAGVDGLSLSGTSDGSTIRSLIIKRFSRDGILIQTGADSITVAGNWIGSDTSGLATMGNGDEGIEILGAYATIGGTGPNDRNVINNNGDEGINITGAGATGNVIQGNFIGLEPDGSSGSGNGDVGIAILSSAGSQTIGGVSAAARNVISMNYEGIEINTSNNVVLGNYIGTDSTGTLDRGNRSDDGVEIQAGSTGNRIGDTIAGAGNLIAYNQRHGVNIVSGTGNGVLGNRIHSNDLRGIDLGNNGVTANDAGDGDSGPNNLQNYPVLDSAITNEVDTIVVYGSLNSIASADFRVEFFSSAAADPSGNGEGETFLGDTTVTTDGTGNASFSAILLQTVSTGNVVTATATDSLNNTSEFSDTVLVTAAPVNDTPTVAFPIPDTTVSENSPVIASYRDLNDVFIDAEDGSALAFNIESNSNPGLLTPSIDADSSLTITIAADSSGTATIVVRATDSGALFVEDTFVVTVSVVLSVAVSDSAFTFGTNPVNTWLAADSSILINDGTGSETFKGNISQFTDGIEVWEITNTTNGIDTVRAQYSTTSNSGPWTDIAVYGSDFTIVTNIPEGDSVTLWFRIETPTATSSYSAYSSDFTVTAEDF
jgi:hypothetical protein